MYKDMDIAERADKLKRLAFQLNVLSSIIKGPYVSGNDMGLADAALFPTLTFCNFMLPEIFGWKQAFTGSKLQAYWDFMQSDADASQVRRHTQTIRWGLCILAAHILLGHQIPCISHARCLNWLDALECCSGIKGIYLVGEQI